MPTPRYAVTGATGQLGGLIARRLAERGVAQRLVVRDPARAPALPGAVVAQASYEDAAAFGSAVEGAQTLLLVSAHEARDRVRQHTMAVHAAVEAGVERIVYTSFLRAGPDATFTFARDHWLTEEHIRQTGLRHVFLRSSLYLDILPWLVGNDGVIRGPAADGGFAPVAREDIADVAIAALLDPALDGHGYDLTGPTAVTMRQVDALAEESGRPIRYHPETLDEAYASRASFGAEPWAVTGWVSSYTAIATGELDVVSDAVARLAGHPPLDLAAFLRRHPDALGALAR